jgi:hypothetical protein
MPCTDPETPQRPVGATTVRVRNEGGIGSTKSRHVPTADEQGARTHARTDTNACARVRTHTHMQPHAGSIVACDTRVRAHEHQHAAALRSGSHRLCALVRDSGISRMQRGACDTSGRADAGSAESRRGATRARPARSQSAEVWRVLLCHVMCDMLPPLWGAPSPWALETAACQGQRHVRTAPSNFGQNSSTNASFVASVSSGSAMDRTQCVQCGKAPVGTRLRVATASAPEQDPGCWRDTY